MKLIIVESPTKAKTISRFLGKEYHVLSSYGHVRDLPKAEIGVDTENNFEPKYVIPSRARKRVSDLKKALKKADSLILAPDEDREGEAIAWHLLHALGLEKKNDIEIKRIVFHEITKSAIEEALKNPRDIDKGLVDAQQARRVLDRLVGYKLSPFLWKKISRGLSAGRVQSVAVRLIVEREREIESFKPEEYWNITALLENNKKDNFEANLIQYKDKTFDKFEIKNEGEADKILKDLEGANYKISSVESKQTRKNPFPPFTTSTLQQASSSKLRFSAKQTMMLAQQLYEGIEIGGEGSVGLITYMRTDSTNLSKESLDASHKFLSEKFGKEYTLDTPRIFKKKSKSAQEAHEAIRPTDPFITPESIKQYLEPKQHKLYSLIWQRFIASQMPAAIFDSLTVNISAGDYTFRTQGQTLKFDGYLKVYPTKFEEVELPLLEKGEDLNLIELNPNQHFTKPPARYNEASLVKTLEKYGIGRPSTYAPIISTIQERNYVQKNRNRYFGPTEIGIVVNDMLVKHFPKIVDMEFTSSMEGEFDEIAQGKEEWKKVIKDFYVPFEINLKEKYEEVSKKDMIEETEEVCEKCAGPMIIRMGRFGKFMACSNFPKCKNTKSLPGKEDEKEKPPEETPKESD